MKKAVTVALSLMLCFVCVASLVSCGGGIKGDEAKALINEFFAAITAEDYEKAASLLHPERPADLKTFFSGIEESEGVDFQAGIEIEKYTGVSLSYYDSTVGGSTYELTMRTRIGEKKVTFTVEVVKNDAGYGIYNLNLDL